MGNQRLLGANRRWLVGAAALALAGSAVAQDQPASTPVETGPAPTAPEPAPPALARPARTQAPPDIQTMAADGLARMSLIILRDIVSPTPDDYRLSALGLRIAQRMRPGGVDEEFLRLERDAWQAAGDEAEAMDATRKIARLAPDDSVTLLAVLSSRIQALQDSDQRMAAYDRLLGKEGEAIDPAIRSRLALDAALLARENGDEAGFVRRLTESTTLDATNKDAAVLYGTYFLDRTTDSRERADLLGNILLADPTDVNAYTNLAIEMFRQGAFVAATRFYDCATHLFLAAGEQLSADEVFDRFLATWMAEGPVACEKQLESMLDERRAVLYAERTRLTSVGLDPGPEIVPRLPTRFEILRLAIAFAAGDIERMQASITSIGALAAEQIDLMEKREPPFEKMTEEQAAAATRQLKLELVFARLWAGVEIDQAEADLNSMADADLRIDLGAAGSERFRAMIAVRRGDVEQGLARLKALADEDLAAALGVGIALEAAGKRDEAIRTYAKLALNHANSAIGAAARGRVETLVGQPLAKTPGAIDLENWASAFAPWLETVSSGPRRYMALSARHVKSQIDLLDRIEVEIRLRNSSRWTLALGPEAPISSRIMLTPRVTVMGVDSAEMCLPEVLDISRRLRLGPGEEIKFVVWAGRGSVGTLTQLTATRATRVRWRLLQGYQMDSERQFQPGSLSLSCETDLLSIDSVPDATREQLLERISTSEGRDLYEALLVAQGSGARRMPGETGEQNLERRLSFAEALAARLPQLNELERLWALTVALPGGLFHAGPPLVESARKDNSPLVKAALLIGPYRSSEVSDPPDLSGDEDPDIARMGQLVNEYRARRQAADTPQ